MPTIIDSLIVELSLDPAKFNKAEREALDSAKKLEQQQLKAAKNIEYGAGRAGDAIGGIKTQALGLLAVLTGGAGVVAFAANINQADASVGRLSRNIGVSVSTISKWQAVARIFGGDAATMAQSFTSISDAFAGWQIGKVSPLIADLRAISTAGGKVIDVNKGVERSMLDLAENLKRIHDSGAEGPARAGLLGRMVGLDPALFDAMISGNLPKVLEMVKALSLATKESADNAGLLEQSWNKAKLSAEGLGRVVLNKLNASGFLNDWSEILEAFAHGEILKGARLYAAGGSGGGFGTYTPSQRIDSSLATTVGSGAGGAIGSVAEREQVVRSEAAKRGINPNIAALVASKEGLYNFKSTIPGETSYGAFQLHVTPGGRGGHLGDQFKAATGLDPSDPKNERAGIAFALDDATKNGWAAFHGAKNNNIDRWAGIDRSGGSSSTSTTEVNIGTVNVTPPAGASPDAWAGSFAAAVKRQSFAAQANAGPQ